MGTRKPLVLVRGGGDIASGTIYRLKRAGYPLMVSEIAIPTMIRRSVCYGNAVHAGQMDLEHRQAYYVPMKEALAMAYTKNIPVVTADYEKILKEFTPHIVVDAILAKRNLGTNSDDADLVIGMGPGFSAGHDVDVVIETMRGHSLGRCIYEGSALANTGVPGNVGGYTHVRVMHAPCAGLFKAICRIGDRVEAGQIVGYVDNQPIKAKIDGILRGILTSGLMVTEGFKLADVDARCQEFHCYTISDKALAIAGGVMEAISAWEVENWKGC